MTDIDIRAFEAAPDLLEDRVVLVTGAGDGIGRSVSLALATHGATVVLLGRTVTKLEATFDAIVAAGGTQPGIVPLNLETAQGDDYHKMYLALDREYGRLDGLLHNAGILGDRSPIEHYDVKVWLKTLHVNLTAAFILTQTCMPLLRKSADASVVFTSSGVGRKGRAYWGAYAVSKFGTEGLMQVLADEMQENTAIRVNSLNPGRTRTNMRLQAYPAEDRDTLPTPEDILAPYLFLLGPASRGISGQAFDCQ